MRAIIRETHPFKESHSEGRTALVNTGECRLYQVTGLEGKDPQLALVHHQPPRGCAMPVVIGDFWVQANAADHRVFATSLI